MNFASTYQRFDAPIASLNCGDRCAPHNERAVPFCCDTRHVVPTAYQAEWEYLESNTDLWHRWQPDGIAELKELQDVTPDHQVLIACLGHKYCQRNFRSLTCRAFPFFPYIDQKGDLLGMSYYWEFEDRCWVLSNLDTVSRKFLSQFVVAYEELIRLMPEEYQNFRYHSAQMRRIFGRQHRAITLLHRKGNVYKVTPRNGRMRRLPMEKLPKFGVYKIAALMPFPDEVDEG